MVNVILYVEGGGGAAQDAECREGFRKLLAKAGLPRMPRIVACGGRKAAYDRFCTAIEHGEGIALLLVDSEDPIAEGAEVWAHLKTRPGDGWDPPSGATEQDVLLMATSMETLIAADREALRRVFSGCLDEARLPPLEGIEARSRSEVLAALKRATEPCGERAYGKGRRSFQVLGELDPTVLRSRLPQFDRALTLLDRHLRSAGRRRRRGAGQSR